jgi:hypothetical protein
MFLGLNRGFSLYEHTPKSPLERGLLECHFLNSVARFWAKLVAQDDMDGLGLSGRANEMQTNAVSRSGAEGSLKMSGLS